jgi:hypothetical protein
MLSLLSSLTDGGQPVSLNNIDQIRIRLNLARQAPAGGKRDGEITFLMHSAMIDARNESGSATRDDLCRRYGFTEAEIDRFGPDAVDQATAAWGRLHGVTMPLAAPVPA